MRSLATVFGLLLILVSSFLRAADSEVSYNRDIRPLLSDRCFACHGPDDAKREAELRLDRDSGEHSPFLSRSGQVTIKPYDANGSELFKRLITEDASLQMPPPESGKKPLTEDQKKLIGKWIEQGAKYEGFWSLEPPRPQALTPVQNVNWLAGRIDSFVLSYLEQKQMKPQGKADKRTLIRRVTLDLTGLPPTREEIESFEQDRSGDAYLRLVDRLLASPRFGEHMGRYWLDLVRFADTNGMHHDNYRELSQYRDWVIRAFNANMAFDQFVTYQLAGDLLENPTIDQQIASGYNRLHMVMDKGTNPPQESYTRNTVDQVVAYGTVFMGMTMECAVCHDHKYDPIKQKDFYQLFAFFNNIDGDPETPGRDQQPPILRLPTPEQTNLLNQYDAQLLSIKQAIEQLKQPASDASGAESSPRTDDKSGDSQKDSRAAELKQKQEELGRVQGARDEVERSIPIALVMKERAELRPAYILKRGAYDQPGEEVFRDTPAFLPPLNSSSPVKTRLDLARWTTDKRNPLTARVTVNRFWQQFFGVGLVRTSEDFGAQGEYPSHPELLDELANSFIGSQWDIKAIVRAIVTSETYQQTSRVASTEYQSDPENRHLSRGSRIRLDSEVIRDQILAISGLLNNAMYGKSVKPPQPTDLWKTVSMASSSTYSFKEDTGDKIYRRSLYTFWKRAMPPPQMTIFDAPTRESCISRRERTNTPIQALMLMNEAQYFQASRHFAKQLLDSENQSDIERIRIAFESVTSQLPDQDELEQLSRGLESFRAVYRDDVDAAKAISADLTFENDAQRNDAQRIELAAFTMLINTLFNLDTTKTRE
jgi:hypothetical protein